MAVPRTATSTDRYLLRQIDKERDFRGDSTVSKTLQDLARERLAQLERQRDDEQDDTLVTLGGGK